MNERIAVLITLFFIIGVIPVGALIFIIRDVNYRAKVRKGLITPPPIVNKQEKDINLPTYIPKGIVTFSPVPKEITFPKKCIYCLESAVHYERLEISATHRTPNVRYRSSMILNDIPFCSKHADEIQTLRRLQYIIWGGVGLTGALLLIFFPSIHILIAIGVLFAIWLILNLIMVIKYPNFSTYGGKGVLPSENIILGLQVIPYIFANKHSASNITKIELVFRNVEYAQLFAKENDTFSI